MIVGLRLNRSGNHAGLVRLVQASVGRVAIFDVWIAWRQYRKRTPDRVNIAEGSKRVRQRGGSGTTHNKATGSEDVDQSG